MDFSGNLAMSGRFSIFAPEKLIREKDQVLLSALFPKIFIRLLVTHEPFI
jgi:hypothetical protein